MRKVLALVTLLVLVAISLAAFQSGSVITGGSVHISGSPAANDCLKYVSPNTITTTGAGCGSGSGSVTSVSTGNLSPLFTAAITNPTSTPALAFTLSSAAANTVLGNNSQSTAAPSYVALGYKMEHVDTTVTSVTAIANTELTLDDWLSLPANELGNNQVIRISARGTLNTTGTQDPTFKVYFGGTLIGSGSLGTNSRSNTAWHLAVDVIANAAPGATAACEVQGQVIVTNGNISAPLINSATVNLATNASAEIKVTITYGNTNASDAIVARQFLVERLN